MSGDYWTCNRCGRDLDPAIKSCECLKHPFAADPLADYDPDDRHKACRGNERRIQVDLDHLRGEYNALLKATNEHTTSCFSERDQLRAELAAAKAVIVDERSPEWADQAIAFSLAKARADKAEAELAEAKKGDARLRALFILQDAIPDCGVASGSESGARIAVEHVKKLRSDLVAANAKLLETTRRYAHQSVDLAVAQRVVEACRALALRVVKVLGPCCGLDTSHGGIADELVPLAKCVLRAEPPRGEKT